MKTLNTFIVAIALVLVNAASFAGPGKSQEKLTIQDAVQSFQDAFVNGKIKGFAELLDDNAKFTSTRGDKVVTHSKSEILEALRKNGNAVQNCETTSELVENLPHQAVIKVSMRYEHFTKENFVTLTESNSGWKITHVTTQYK